MRCAGRYDNSFLSIFPVGDTTRYVPDDLVCSSGCKQYYGLKAVAFVLPTWQSCGIRAPGCVAHSFHRE